MQASREYCEFGVAVLLVVGPELRREAHNRNKVRGAHNNHLFVIGFAPEVGVAVHSCEISAFVGHKHYHEVGRAFHMFLIGFGVEFGDVRFHRTEVFFESIPAVFIVVGVCIIGVSRDAHFRAHHKHLVVGEED